MVGVGVVGAGEWGKNHVRVLSQLHGARLALVCDTDPARRRMVGESFGVATTGDVEELLARTDVEAVTVCTPASTHAELVRRALEAGKHVLVEKPFTLDSRSCRQLTELARRRGLVLMVGHIFRFDPAVEVLRREVEGGMFGRVCVASSTRIGLRTPRADCGVVFDFAVHDFDTLCHVLGRAPLEVTATTGSYLPQSPHEDVAFVALRFPDDILANVTVSWLTPRKVRELWLVGDARSAHLDHLVPQLDVFDFDYLAFLEANGYRYDSYGAFKALTQMGNVSQPFIPKHEPLRLELEHFLRCVATGEAPLTPGKAGLDAVRIAEAALRSARERRSVRLNL